MADIYRRHEDENAVGWNSFYADADIVAAIRMALGLKSYGYLPDREDGDGFSGLVETLLDDALSKLAECPERARLLFQQVKTQLKLFSAVATKLGFDSWNRDDIKITKIRDEYHKLVGKRAEAGDASSPDPTRLGILLDANYTITKELEALDKKVTRKRRR